MQPSAFDRLDRLEAPICLWLAGFHSRPIGSLFKLVSWLGNGPLWGILVAGLISMADYREAGLAMLAVTLFNAMVYRQLKAKTVRRRPFNRLDSLTAGAIALDQFSFPSGHTLHAVSLTVMCSVWVPVLAIPMMVLTALIALSRVILGLHYPSDVAMGALIGIATASMAVYWIGA